MIFKIFNNLNGGLDRLNNENFILSPQSHKTLLMQNTII